MRACPSCGSKAAAGRSGYSLQVLTRSSLRAFRCYPSRGLSQATAVFQRRRGYETQGPLIFRSSLLEYRRPPAGALGIEVEILFVRNEQKDWNEKPDPAFSKQSGIQVQPRQAGNAQKKLAINMLKKGIFGSPYFFDFIT